MSATALNSRKRRSVNGHFTLIYKFSSNYGIKLSIYGKEYCRQ